MDMLASLRLRPFASSLALDGGNVIVVPSTAVVFDGATALEAAASASQAPAGGLVLEMWLRLTGSGVANVIASKIDYSTATSYSLARGDGTNADAANLWVTKTSTDTGDRYTYSYRGVIPESTWFHFAAVFDPAGVTEADRQKLYINGNRCALQFLGSGSPYSSAIVNSGAAFLLGAMRIAGTLDRFLVGRMRRARLWGGPLTQADILAIMQGGVPGTPVSSWTLANNTTDSRGANPLSAVAGSATYAAYSRTVGSTRYPVWIVGDSIPRGYVNAPDIMTGGWPSGWFDSLQENTTLNVLPYGVGSAFGDEGGRRGLHDCIDGAATLDLAPYVAAGPYGASLGILSCGINDLIGGVALATIKSRWTALFHDMGLAITSAGAIEACCMTPYTTSTAAWTELNQYIIYRALLESQSITTYLARFDTAITVGDLDGGGVHPTAAGQALLEAHQELVVAGPGSELAGYAFGFDAPDLVAGSISSITDKGMTRRTATQGTAGARPTASGTALTFDGGDALAMTDVVSFSAWHAFYAFKMNALPSGGGASFSTFRQTPTSSTDFLIAEVLLILGAGGYTDGFNFIGNLTSTPDVLVGAAWAGDLLDHVLSVSYSGGTPADPASYTCRLDGVALSPLAAGGAISRAVTDKTAIGARVDAANAVSGGASVVMYGFRVFPRVLGSTERDAIESEMTDLLP